MKKWLCMLVISLSFLVGCQDSSKVEILSENLSNYYMKIDVDCENKTLSCYENLNFINNGQDSLKELRFHLYANAFKNKDTTQPVVSEYNFERAYPNGFDAGFIEIKSIKIKDIQIAFILDGEENNILILPLLKELLVGERVEIELNFEVKIPNIRHRFGYAENSINVGNFYPIVCMVENGEFVQDGYHFNGDPFYSDIANYEVEIEYDKNYTIGCTGDYSTEIQGDKKITKSNARVVRDFAFVLSDKYSIDTAVTNDVSINYLHYNDSDVNQTMQAISDTIITFEDLIGDYPYSTLTVVQSNFLHGGMEYPNLVLISDEVHKREDYLNVVVHEIAHQWFYGIIGNDEYKEAWLDEGLTEYSTALFFEINPQYGIEYSEIIGTMLTSYQLFVDVYTDIFGSIDTSMTRNLSEYSSEAEYTYCVYVKSVLMFDHLRELIGDSAFYLGLKNYYASNQFKIATQEDLISAFQKASNKNIESIFMTWLNGTAILQNVGTSII